MAVIYVGDSQLKYFLTPKPSVRFTRGARVEELVVDLDDLSGFRVGVFFLFCFFCLLFCLFVVVCFFFFFFFA